LFSIKTVMSSTRADLIGAILNICGSSVAEAGGLDPKLSEDTTQLKALIAKSKLSNSQQLLGAEAALQAEVSQWISFAFAPVTKEQVLKLNQILLRKSYLVGSCVTIADFAVFIAISQSIGEWITADFPEVSRWAAHIKSIGSSSLAGTVSAPIMHSPTFIPIPSPESVVTPAAPSSSSANQQVVASPAVEPTADLSGNKEAKGKGKAESKSSVGSDAPASAPVLDPTKLEIRCGHVLKCWDHAESEKLLCEEIDMGGGEVRTIASGLRAFYKAEELQGRKVVVLANLKERPMAGFKSQGMVLCAVSSDHSVVKLLEPPATAEVGDRVVFPGFPADAVPATPAQMAKKKILEGLAPMLRTDAEGVAHWDQSPFKMGAAGGVCSAPGVANATVS